MSKIIVTADIHNKLFGAYAAEKSTINNSRFKAIRDVLDQILAHALKIDARAIVIVGDIYDTKNIIESYVYNTFWDFCVRVGEERIELFLIAGNHDISSLGDENITLLHAFKSLRHVHVVDEPTVFANDMFGGYCNCVMVPFRRDVNICRKYIESARMTIENNKDEVFRKNNDPINLLFYHGAITGAKLTNREFSDEKNSISLKDLSPDFYDLVFLGHFHTHQKLAENVRYVGSPLQHDMSDADNQHGFYEVDMKNFKISFINTTYPAFHKVVIERREDIHKIDALLANDYYDITVTTDDVTEKDVKHLRTKSNIKIAFENSGEAVETRIDIKVDTDIDIIVDKYVDSVDKNSNHAILKELGKQLIREAKRNEKR